MKNINLLNTIIALILLFFPYNNLLSHVNSLYEINNK